MISDAVFWGCNFRKEIEKFYNSKKEIMTENMSEEQVKLYELGMFNTLQILDMLCECSEPNDIVFYDKDCETTTEFGFDDMEEKYHWEL